MTRFLASAIVLAVIPMSMLNPLGRPAFLGYYLGVITMSLLFVIIGKGQRLKQRANHSAWRHAGVGASV